MIEDMLRFLKRRTGQMLPPVPGKPADLALLQCNNLARQICDEIVNIANDNLAEKRIQDSVKGMPPAELARLYAEMRNLSSCTGIDRLQRIAPLWHLLTNRPAPEYRAVTLSSHATLYERHSGFETNTRAVLICFTDYVDQIFMPCSQFLFMIGTKKAPPVSVVTLRAGAPGTFCHGIPGLGTTLAESMKVLRTRLNGYGYLQRAYLGASMGGFFALRAAILDDGAPGVSISGRFLRIGEAVHLGSVGPAHDLLMCTKVGAAANLHCLYGANEEVDQQHARRLSQLMPSVLMHPIPDCVEHNPLITLRARRTLRPFLISLAEMTVLGNQATGLRL